MACRWDEIQKHIGKLEKRHAVHIASYGEGNERRLTGKHETSSMHDFRSALRCSFTCTFTVRAKRGFHVWMSVQWPDEASDNACSPSLVARSFCC